MALKLTRFVPVQGKHIRLSLFEKVILANSVMLIGEALAGLWVTSHNLEAHHYLIDTSFLVLATLLGLIINALLLRTSFRPLFTLLSTIRAVSMGKTSERVTVLPSDSEIGELAQAFNTMLDRLETAQKEQTMLIVQAQEEERRRLALELHDESSQNLTAMLVHMEILSLALQAIPESTLSCEAREPFVKGLTNLTALTQRTLEDIRTLAQQLRPSVLDDLGLHAAFRWLVEDARQRFRLAVKLRVDGIEETVSENRCSSLHETALFRIAQESLTNVARHAHAHHVSISLTQEHDHFCLQVSDDGCGYDPVQHTSGFGIFGMRERTRLLGGSLHIQSSPGRGTTVEAKIPLYGVTEGTSLV